MTSVKLGFVMVGSVSAHMPVPAPLQMRNVWNVNEVSGTMEAEYSVALFVKTFSVKMINLNIKPAARF